MESPGESKQSIYGAPTSPALPLQDASEALALSAAEAARPNGCRHFISRKGRFCSNMASSESEHGCCTLHDQAAASTDQGSSSLPPSFPLSPLLSPSSPLPLSPFPPIHHSEPSLVSTPLPSSVSRLSPEWGRCYHQS